MRMNKPKRANRRRIFSRRSTTAHNPWRSEEHTSELQSQSNLVCRLLLEKKKAIHIKDVHRLDSTGLAYFFYLFVGQHFVFNHALAIGSVTQSDFVLHIRMNIYLMCRGRE